jgi:Predicted site-specific integrase-resolvase
MVDIANYPRLLNITQAAELMGVSRDFLHKCLRKDQLPTIELGGKRWVLRDPLLRQLGCLTEDESIILSNVDSQLIRGVSVIIDLLQSISETLQDKT